MRVPACFAALAFLTVPVAAAQDQTAAKDPRNFSWVLEGVLAIGGGGLNGSDVEWLAANGFGAIADFRKEHEDPRALIESKGMAFLDMPIDSASHMNATQFATFVEWANAQEAAGRVMYVHCTNGWHRAAAFAVAWDMARTGEAYDEAAREAAQRRAGTVMRAVSGLLDYRAELTGAPQLAVVLDSRATRPEPGATMSVSVDVYAGGARAANAAVTVWSEETKLRLDGVTDAKGRFTFAYAAPATGFMDHLYARASLAGFAEGADNVEVYFQQPLKARGALEVVAERTSEGLHVRVTHAGRAIPARVVANAPGWTAFEASDLGEVTFQDAPTDAISIRAVSWGSQGGLADVATASAPTPTPTPTPPTSSLHPPPSRRELAAEQRQVHSAPPIRELPSVEPPAAPFEKAEDGRVLALRYAAAALAGALALALYVGLSRRRSGVGNR